MKSYTKAAKSVFEQIRDGLEDTLAYTEGRLDLNTVVVPSPPPKTSPGKIAGLRREFQMSQAVFAAVLNVSTKTIQAWEQGLRTPSHASARLLEILQREPEVVRKMVARPRAVAAPTTKARA